MGRKKFSFENINWLLLLLVLFIIVSALFFLSYREVKQNAVTEFNKQQMILAEQAASGITEFFSTLTGEFEFLVNMNDVAELNDNGKKILIDYLARKKPILSSISRINSNGRMIWLTPFNSKLIGTDISYQKHVQYIIKNQTPTLSDVFMAVQGYRAIAFHYPIIKNRKFRGSIALLINFEYISGKYLEHISIGETGYAWMISQDGIIIYSPVKEQRGVSVYDAMNKFPDLLRTTELMMRGEKGTSVYQYNKIKNIQTDLLVKHAAYTPVNIMNTHWSIAVSTPESYIISNVQGFKNKSIIIMLIFAGIGVVFLYFAYRNIIMANEIESRKKNENMLKSQEENLRITLNSIGDAVIATDDKGIIKRMNPAAEETTGWSFSEAEGKFISEIFNIINLSTDEPCENPFDLVLKKKHKIDISSECNLQSKNGKTIEISGSFAPISDSSGSVVGIILVFRDITEKNRIEEQLNQARKMDVVGQLAGGIAHDFNNMLSGIMGSAELLSYETGNNQKMKHHIDLIIESAKRSSNLTSQLLAFSRKGKIISASINIHELIKGTIDLLERSIDKRISIITKLSAEHNFTTGDPTLIQNAILNLVINARDAMPDGGTITISTVNVILDHELIKNNSFNIEPGQYLEIDVSDTGKGIPRGIMTKIFDPFFTTKPAGKGTGLGLSTVYGTIKDHRGAISVYSEPGKGTIFKMYLPQSRDFSTEEKPPERFITKGSGTILVIDDESIIRNTANGILTAAGYDVLLAEDGIQGTEIYSIEKEKISLVILDMVMPKISGMETLKLLKKINPEVKVIFASGFNNQLTVNDINNSGAKGFIQKPYLMAEFTKKIDEIIRS